MFLDIIDYYSIIVEVNLEVRGFTIFTKSSLLLHIFYIVAGNNKISCSSNKLYIPGAANN